VGDENITTTFLFVNLATSKASLKFSKTKSSNGTGNIVITGSINNNATKNFFIKNTPPFYITLRLLKIPKETIVPTTISAIPPIILKDFCHLGSPKVTLDNILLTIPLKNRNGMEIPRE
jgi:hypothetical protein